MEGRALRSRTAVPHSEDEAPVLDSESYWSHDQSESNSDGERTVTQFTQPEPTTVKYSAPNLANVEPRRNERLPSENVNSISNTENILAQVLVVMQANYEEVPEKLEWIKKKCKVGWNKMVETYRAKYSQVTRNCMGYKSS
jgi:hypothetical protein